MGKVPRLSLRALQSGFASGGIAVSPRSVTLHELASGGSFFISMFWYFYRGLEPRLQRAHAGHTQGGGQEPPARPA